MSAHTNSLAPRLSMPPAYACDLTPASTRRRPRTTVARSLAMHIDDDWVVLEAPQPRRKASATPKALGIVRYQHNARLCPLALRARSYWDAAMRFDANTLTRFGADAPSLERGLSVIASDARLLFFMPARNIAQAALPADVPCIEADAAGETHDVMVRHYTFSQVEDARRAFVASGYVDDSQTRWFAAPRNDIFSIRDGTCETLQCVRYVGVQKELAFAWAWRSILGALQHLHTAHLLHRQVALEHMAISNCEDGVVFCLTDFERSSDVLAPYSECSVRRAPESILHPHAIPGARFASLATTEAYAATTILLETFFGIKADCWVSITSLSCIEREMATNFWEALRLRQPMLPPAIMPAELAHTFQVFWTTLHALPEPLPQVAASLLAFASELRAPISEALEMLDAPPLLSERHLAASDVRGAAAWGLHHHTSALRERLSRLPALTLAPLSQEQSSSEDVQRVLRALGVEPVRASGAVHQDG